MYIEYIMSKELAKNILKKSKNDNMQKILCDFVNEQYDIKGICRKVTIR